MNLTFGIVGFEAEFEFSKGLVILGQDSTGLLNYTKSADGQAFFGISQPTGYYPLNKPVFNDTERKLSMLQGYLWYGAHFPLSEEEAVKQISDAALDLSRSGRLNLGTADGGVFNFFLYDQLKRCLFITSDYSGIHPLYYSLSGKHIFFSNHIRLLSKLLGRAYDPIGLIQRTALHYTVGKRTLFEGIFRLRPGECLKYEVGEASVRISQPDCLYTSLNSYKDDWEAADAIYADLTDGFRELSRPPGKRGIFLSGGYDSRLISAGFAQQGSPMTAVVIGEENNPEVKLALRVAECLGIDIKVNDPTEDCQLTQQSIDKLIAGPETVNFTHFHSPTKNLKFMRAESSSTGYGGDTLIGGNGYALFGNQYNARNRFKLGLKRSFGLPVQFSAAYSTFGKEYISQSIYSYFDNYLLRSLTWFSRDWVDLHQSNLLEKTHEDIDSEIRRYLSSSPESSLQVFERFWREHQELYTGEILTTINNILPLSLPTMHHTFVERCSNLAPNMKVDNGIYQKIVRKYLGNCGGIPTGSTPLPGKYPDLLLLLSRVLRGLDDKQKTRNQLRSKGKTVQRRYGWTNFESWFRAGNFLQHSPAYINENIYSREYLEMKIKRWMDWEEKLFSGQELLTMITISQLLS